MSYGSNHLNYITNNDNYGDFKILGNIQSIDNNKIELKS